MKTKKKSNKLFKNKCLKSCHKKHLKKFNKRGKKQLTKKNWAEFVKASKKYGDCEQNCNQKGGKSKRKSKYKKGIRRVTKT